MHLQLPLSLPPTHTSPSFLHRSPESPYPSLFSPISSLSFSLTLLSHILSLSFPHSFLLPSPLPPLFPLSHSPFTFSHVPLLCPSPCLSLPPSLITFSPSLPPLCNHPPLAPCPPSPLFLFSHSPRPPIPLPFPLPLPNLCFEHSTCVPPSTLCAHTPPPQITHLLLVFPPPQTFLPITSLCPTPFFSFS